MTKQNPNDLIGRIALRFRHSDFVIPSSFVIFLMEILRSTAGLGVECPLFLAIGAFDGVHLGHQAVISTSARHAHSEDLRSIHIRPQNFGRMWIERDNNRRSIFRMGMPRRSGDDGLVTEVHAVERADGEEKRTV